MSSRKAFALRIDEKTLAAMHRWAEDDLRSLNGQIEFLITDIGPVVFCKNVRSHIEKC